MEAASLHYGVHRLLQHPMDIGAKLRRVHLGGLPLPDFQAVFEKISQPALGLQVNLGGRKVQALSVKALNLLPLHRSQIEGQLLQNPIIILRQAQVLCLGLTIAACQVGGGLLGVCQGCPQTFPGGKHAPCQLRQSAADEGGLSAGAGDPHGLPAAAEYPVNLSELRLDALHGTAGEGHSQAPQGITFPVGQNAGAAGIPRQAAF